MARGGTVRLIVLALAMAGAAGVAGWTADDNRAIQPATISEGAWQLPNWHPPVTAPSLRLLSSRMPWGPETSSGDLTASAAAAAAAAAAKRQAAQQSAAATAAAAAATEWHLVGIIAKQQDPLLVVMVKDPGQAKFVPRYRRIGEQLPDGSTVTAIAGNVVTVSINGQSKFISLFPLKT